MAISIAAFVVGTILLLIAEVGGIDRTRIFGVTLIALAGIGIGTDTGLADPRKFRVPTWMRRWRSAIGVTATVLAVIPAVIVLVAILVGMFVDSGEPQSGLLVGIGAVIAILMLLAVLATAGVTIQSIIRAANSVPMPGDPSELNGEGGGL